MKKPVFIFVLLAMATCSSLIQSCKARQEAVQDVISEFDFDGATAGFNIPITADTLTTHNGDTTTVDLNLTGDLKKIASIVGLDDLESITIKECTFTINNPNTTNDASNFKTLSVHAYTDANATPVRISENNNVPDSPGSTTIALSKATVNMLDYMKTATKIYYFTTYSLRRPTTQALSCTLKVKYHVRFK